MLQENEVRIGNAVKDSTGRIGTIMSIGKNQVRVRFEFSTVKIDTNHDENGLDVEAVPLTTDILKKCGFIEKKDWYYKEKFLLGFLTTEDNLQAEWKFGGVEGVWNLINIKYLHQLQNLYYSLVGSELEVVW